ncbi:hypothetical protein BO99DRAFT_50007 [Aspergillus violaceofuscus CBS 115571]|uniref:Uncharacterized protein n=1 Tax=Aspergillus violaceofuscus (strain CBS 115571) TaxID=1450538 RepID=A0A2V5GQZ6_ASPV1|nr:hypothetical protein BO99DRAFT_50007 [Aspergillus violaceofuscus CBS 115571]
MHAALPGRITMSPCPALVGTCEYHQAHRCHNQHPPKKKQQISPGRSRRMSCDFSALDPKTTRDPTTWQLHVSFPGLRQPLYSAKSYAECNVSIPPQAWRVHDESMTLKRIAVGRLRLESFSPNGGRLFARLISCRSSKIDTPHVHKAAFLVASFIHFSSACFASQKWEPILKRAAFPELRLAVDRNIVIEIL